MTERSDLSLRNLLHRMLFETLCKITKFLLTFYPHKSIIIAVGKTTAYVPVAQPDRVFGYEPKGQGFESLQARHKNRSSQDDRFFQYTSEGIPHPAVEFLLIPQKEVPL